MQLYNEKYSTMVSSMIENKMIIKIQKGGVK